MHIKVMKVMIVKLCLSRSRVNLAIKQKAASSSLNVIHVRAFQGGT